MSPLGVLARGYAVCWAADRAHIVRAATDVAVGDAVHVTLAHGGLDCEVIGQRLERAASQDEIEEGGA